MSENFSSLKACFCRIKWLTSYIRQTTEITSPDVRINICKYQCMGVAGVHSFPTVGGVTLQRNLIGLRLLCVVNNCDLWMRKAWERREASHVVRTRFGTRLLHSPVRYQSALRRIYSVQRIRDHEPSTFCTVNLCWFGGLSNKIH